MTWEFCDQPEVDLQKRLSLWESQIEREGGLEIYNEIDPRIKLRMVNEKIASIEQQSDQFSGDSKFIFLELSLDVLRGVRWRLRNQVLAQEVPDRKVPVTDAEIEWARSVPLEKMFQKLPRDRKVCCPYHHEKTPSFHVYQRGYCFGCGVSIDSIQWSMDQLGLSFVEAVKALSVLGNV